MIQILYKCKNIQLKMITFCNSLEQFYHNNNIIFILRIVLEDKSYREALSILGQKSLQVRRQAACDKLFKQIMDDPNHRL